MKNFSASRSPRVHLEHVGECNRAVPVFLEGVDAYIAVGCHVWVKYFRQKVASWWGAGVITAKHKL
jgi:hypothetical protein